MADSYMNALLARRGRGMDPSMLISDDHDQDLTKGRGLAAGGIQDMDSTLGMTDPGHAGIDQRLGVDLVPPDVKNSGSALKTPSDMDHTRVVHESATAAPEPLSQSTGEGGGELGSEILDHIAGHGSQNEYELLKGMRPRSLGERAKMDALKSKFEPGSGKSG